MMTQNAIHPIASDTTLPSGDEWLLMASLSVIAASGMTEEPAPPRVACRLLALVPDLDFDEVDLAQRVWSLADPRGLPVLYLGLATQPDRELLVRRRLATLAALTRDNRIHVDTRCQRAHGWAEAIADAARPGDLIVCPPEQAIVPPWNGTASTRQGQTAVHVLPNLRVDPRPDRNRRWMRLAFWPIALAMIAAFFWLQAQIGQSTVGIARTALLSLTVAAEGGLLMLWHVLTS